MLDFNKIVNKMYKRWWKIILKNDIFELIDPERKQKYKSYLDKTIYRLKAEKVIISIKSWVYIVPDSNDLLLNHIDLIEKYYLRLLKKYISSYVWNNYFISWNKSLQIHMKDFSIPEKIFIINRNINKRIKIWMYDVIFKTISWKLDNKKINLYSRLSTYVVKKEIEDNTFKISCLELSLIESALITDNIEWLDFNLLNKTIKKYSKVFDKQIFSELGKFKFIMSFNRLKEISRNIDNDLYKHFLDIIKNNGGLFIWEWLRWF